MRTLLAALTALMLFATPAVAQTWNDADDAYKAGNYEKAFRIWKPIAEQGHLFTQFRIAGMYSFGKGVPKNESKAVYWYRRAAKQGAFYAQQELGYMYFRGYGVPKDYVQAYAWWSACGVYTYYDCRMDADSLEREMTREQIARGQELAAKYFEKYVKPFQKD